MTSLVLLDTAAQQRRRFIGNLGDAVGRSNIRAFYAPGPGEGATVPDEFVAGGVWTHGTSLAGRLTALGRGQALAFNGTTDYITTPDRSGLSFGNAVTDTAFSVAALVNVTDTASPRAILSKFNNPTAEEYLLRVEGTDNLTLYLEDQSLLVSPNRATNAAITQGSWNLYSATYSAATGGALAANDITLYQNGAVIASTVAQAATYVAMEDTAAALEIGSQNAHAANFFSGSIAMVMVWQSNAAIGVHRSLKDVASAYYGLSLT